MDRGAPVSPGAVRPPNRADVWFGELMVMDALRGYLQLASGLTEVTREKARQAAKAVIAQATGSGQGEHQGDARAQVRALADELATTARSNRDLLLGMVRVEAERAVAGLGIATNDEVAALRRRVERLERRRGDSGEPAPAAKPTPAKSAPAKSAPAKKTAAKQTPSKPSPTTAKQTTAKSAPATSAPAKKTAAKKATSKQTPAKKTP